MSAESFLRIANRDTDDIYAHVNNHHTEVVFKNNAALASVVKCLLFCEQQDISLRGHGSEQSNFMGTHKITFPAWSGIKSIILPQHLNMAGTCLQRSEWTDQCLCWRAPWRYCCWLQQCRHVCPARWWMHGCCKHGSKSPSVFVSLIYIATEMKIREEFLGFVLAPRTTGAAFTRTFLQALEDYGIHTDNIRVQSYDGAPNMSGIHNGVQVPVKRQYPHAAYMYYRAHCLNICIVHACQLPRIRNMMGTLQQVPFAFKYSAKRLTVCNEELNENENAWQKWIGKQNYKPYVKQDGSAVPRLWQHSRTLLKIYLLSTYCQMRGMLSKSIQRIYFKIWLFGYSHCL